MDMNNTPEPRMPLVENLEFLDLMGVISSPCIICVVRIRRSAGARRTRLTSTDLWLRRHWPPDAMASSAMNLWTVGCADPRLTAQARSPMDKPGKTPCVSPTLPTGRRLPTSFTEPRNNTG
jgi:hypothetical protein